MITFCSLTLAAQVQVALFAGPQATSTHYTVKEVQQPADHKYGGMGGVALKVPFDQNLFFFPAVYYSLKGYQVTLNNPSFPPAEQAVNNNTTVHTVEIAPLLQLDFSKKDAHFFVRMGPSVDFAFYGKERFDTSLNGSQPVERDMIFSFADYGRITAALNVHAGYEVSRGLLVFLHYSHGVGSMNNADGGPKILHRIAGISIGWLFGRNPNVLDTRNRQ
ncbi:MAG TPA: porin family protein [Flavisolibacter sp.]